jgi:hypothetical protein
MIGPDPESDASDVVKDLVSMTTLDKETQHRIAWTSGAEIFEPESTRSKARDQQSVWGDRNRDNSLPA